MNLTAVLKALSHSPGRIMNVRFALLAIVCVCSLGCGDQQGSQTNMDLEPREDAICDFAGPKALCRASAEGVRAHIEEFGPLQKEMDWIILDGFDPNDVEELKVIESTTELRLNSIESEDLSFLAGLKKAYRIQIERNPKLKSLKGLENLNRVKHSLRLDENALLKSLEGLGSLTYIGDPQHGEGLTIFDNDSLESIENLSALESVFSIVIQNNNALENPGTLPKLKDTHGLIFRNNDGLISAGNYPVMEPISTLLFEDNDVFPDCEAEKLAESLPSFEGELTLDNNKPNSRCADLE
jgi:hypothetical protein